METVTTLTHRQPDSVGSGASHVGAPADRTLTVTVTYLLSEEGRKASLLGGGDGREVQLLAIDVPANRLHLVSVDANGVARLKLRPRFQLGDDQRVLRMDASPVYDVPPDIEDLFRAAAQNHQLERAYETERRSAKAKRREADAERRAELATAFLGDPTQRALVHPAPTPKRCWLGTANGRVVFDVSTDVGPAHGVPAEAHRRFRADLRSRREQNLKTRAEQLALHEEKKAFIADWIAAHGTSDQQARQAAGVLSMEEAIEAITDKVFGVLANRPRYLHDGIDRLQQHVRQVPEHADALVTRDALVVTGADAKNMTAAQWAIVQEIQMALPGATVTLRMHQIAWKCDLKIALDPIFGVLATKRIGPFTVRREYSA